MRGWGVYRRLQGAWNWLSRLGVIGRDRIYERYVMGANHLLALASVVILAWAIGFWVHLAPHQWLPAFAHTALFCLLVICVWLNSRGWHTAAVTVGLGVPLVHFIWLSWLFSSDAGYQLVPLTLTASAYVTIPLSKWPLRVGFTAVAAVATAWVWLDPRFAEPHLEVPGLDVRYPLLGNVLAATLLIALPAAFNDYYLTRERQRAAHLVEQAEFAARTDALTGVLNRRGLAPLFSAAVRDGEYAVALVDLDRFKYVNDRLGHSAGDVVLEEVAKKLTRAVGDEGTVSRWGGEEFLVLMPQVSAQRALRIVERARAAVERDTSDAGVLRRVTLSAGVAHVPQGTSREEALRIADRLLYAAKDAGRNRVLATTVRGMRHVPID